MKKKKNKAFEDYINNLNEIVKKMESDDMNLEDMIDSYEDGMNLMTFCRKQLNEVEHRVVTLIKDNDEFIEREGID